MKSNPGYHLVDIEKGVLGEFSKIEEEFLELKDARQQNSKIMELVELSDLLGSIELYVKTQYNLELDDLLIMKNITKRAFVSGNRK